METDQQRVNPPPAAHLPSRSQHPNSTDDVEERPEHSITMENGILWPVRLLYPSLPNEEGRRGTLQVLFQLLPGTERPSALPRFRNPPRPDRLRYEATHPDAVARSPSPGPRPRDHESHNARREMSERCPDTEGMGSDTPEETLLFSRVFGLRQTFANHTTTEKTTTDSNMKRVIICYGGQGNISHGSAFVVLVEANDPESQWQQLQNQYFEKRGREGLRRVLERLGYGVKEVRIGKVRIQQLPSDTNDGMLVHYRMLDSKSEAERLAQFAEAQKHIAEPYRGDRHGVPPENGCFYDDEGNFSLECYKDFDPPNPCCKVAEYRDKMRELGQWQAACRNAEYIRKPRLAGAHQWNGIPQRVRYTEGKLKGVYETARYRHNLPTVEFDGLHIVEGWTLDTTSVAVPALATTLFVVVMASRLLYGDWATAWTVAGSLSGFTAVGLMWIHRELGR